MNIEEKATVIHTWCDNWIDHFKTCEGCPLYNSPIQWCCHPDVQWYCRPELDEDKEYIKYGINKNYDILMKYEAKPQPNLELEDGLGVKIFISGKITGDPNYKEKFAKAEQWLTDHNFVVLNPAKCPRGMNIGDYMFIGLTMLQSADWVYMLKDWEDSRGARIEHEYASYVGKHIAYEENID